jgi:predicted oxidoreductase (fatty acid repression mutant protein)
VTPSARGESPQGGHRQGPYFSDSTEASWIALSGLALASLLEHENDLIAAHVLTTGHVPAAQFLG